MFVAAKKIGWEEAAGCVGWGKTLGLPLEAATLLGNWYGSLVRSPSVGMLANSNERRVLEAVGEEASLAFWAVMREAGGSTFCSITCKIVCSGRCGMKVLSCSNNH